jgi:hypothetical protein
VIETFYYEKKKRRGRGKRKGLFFGARRENI